jgi:CRISPR-associated protein Csm4
MQTYKLTLEPLAAFGTPLVGDTLFGQLCWALRWRQGEAALGKLLDGYTAGQPYAVISDAFPAGMLPRPTLPAGRLRSGFDPAQRKAERRRIWLPADRAGTPLAEWSSQAVELNDKANSRIGVLTQNTIDRLTNTTGTGPFAPRQVERIVYPVGSRLEVYAVTDTARLGIDDLRQAWQDIGAQGYGRDASTGLGKFALLDLQPYAWPMPAGARHALTLAACAPDPAALDADDCHYQPITRFGRHGSLHVLTGQPFKKPLLMMRTAAVLALRAAGVEPGGLPHFHGQGLGGADNPISAAEPATVHQGYAPLLPLALSALERAAA